MNERSRRERREAAATGPRLHNRMYRAVVARTQAGSPVVELAPANPKGRFAHHRQLAAFIYDLAAEMERRSEAIAARWVVSPEPTHARLVLELTGDDDTALADAFVARVLADFDLA